MSDIEALPTHVAHAALQEGIFLAGDESAREQYATRIEAEYEAESADRDEERRQFIDRLARGDV